MSIRIKLSQQSYLPISTEVGNFHILLGAMKWQHRPDTLTIVAVGPLVVHLSADFRERDARAAWMNGFDLNESDGPDARIIVDALIAVGLAQKLDA